MKKSTNNKKEKQLSKSPIFLIALLNFIIITLIIIYLIYLRFIPYKTITYDGYAVSEKDLVNNLLNTTFDVKENIAALEVKDQDDIYVNLKSYYIGADKKKNINLNYPIYVNDQIALYNLSSDVNLYTDELKIMEGYSGFTLTSGALYNSNTLERADYHNYILMKNSDGIYINTQELKINTSSNKYKIKMNSIINFNEDFITYYTLEDGNFVYSKILDIDMNSEITIKEYNKEYIYKDFLKGLGFVIKDKETENSEIEENATEEEMVNNTTEEQITENIIQDENKDETEEDKGESNPTEWQKPKVSSTDFVPNVYTAITEVSIEDPSKAMCTGITYTFYIDEDIAFRASTLYAGMFKVTKLIPNTKYKVIGTYQYKNEDEEIIEVKCFEQEFKTKNTKNIKPIDLNLKNEKIYSNKIQITDLKINSDLADEAVAGVSRAEIELNGTPFAIKTATLMSILSGKTEKYELTNGVESNSKYEYEIKFYDTADNEMKLTNNTGSTNTSKTIPSVEIRLNKQDAVSTELSLVLNNKDKVELSNYRYIMYNENGKIYKKDKLSSKTDKLFFDNLDSQMIYTIKIYDDFDLEDRNGVIENQEIGNATFTTVDLSSLGTLKLEVDYEESDLTYNNIKFSTKINTEKTDSRLVKILKEVNISVLLEDKVIKSINITDISSITKDILVSEIENLESNTKYDIVITAKAMQGNVEEEIITTYTLKSFVTKKKPAKLNIKNVVVTNNLIDLDLMIDDKDGASLDGKYKIFLREVKDSGKVGDIIYEKDVKVFEKSVRCEFKDLNKDETYILICQAELYNETNNDDNKVKDYEIKRQTYKTSGLEGDLELISLKREILNKDIKTLEGKNLIDIQSNNNWYSQCFNVLSNEYQNGEFVQYADRNFGKEYEYSDNKDKLKLTSNQCYVYDFEEYIRKNCYYVI